MTERPASISCNDIDYQSYVEPGRGLACFAQAAKERSQIVDEQRRGR